jgi:hypothetical protein
MATLSLTPAGHGPDSPHPILRDWLVEPRVPPLLQPRQACRQFGQLLLVVLQFIEQQRNELLIVHRLHVPIGPQITSSG